MADLAQVLATYDALVGVAVGAGLTYGFSALNRRHAEAREDRTRWYEQRRQAYVKLVVSAFAVKHMLTRSEVAPPTKAEKNEKFSALHTALAEVRIVGSAEARQKASDLYDVAFKARPDGGESAEDAYIEARKNFEAVARNDLGHA
jgi:hypothetical protein